jgi:hypothetical protein
MSQQQNVKYPSQPPYRATVDAPLIKEHEQNNHGCAKCFMSLVSFVFIILGLAMTALGSYTLIVLHYGGKNILSGYSLATVYALMVVGIVLVIISVIVWVSSCKPTAVCSKIILILFSIVMIVVFLVQMLLLVLGCVWLGYINLNVTAVTGESTDRLFNDSVEELQNLCCTDFNQSICDHIIVDDNLAADCSNFNLFYQAVVAFLMPMLKWVAVFLGVVGFLNLVAFFCSCCLLCSRKRSAYYKPATTGYQNA